MTIRLRTIFMIVLGLFVLGFLYIERTILTPFILAAVFAYIFNPVVNFFDNKVRLPRGLSIIIIYLIIVSLFIAFIFFLAKGLITQSVELRQTVNAFLIGARGEINLLPPDLRANIYQTANALENNQIFKVTSIFEFFPRAISGAIALIIFLVSSFYFLKEGKQIINKSLIFVPINYKVEVEILLRKINTVLGEYLRGELLMVFLVSLILFIALSILGVKFALIIAIFSGIAEIVPIVGPIVATVIAVLVVLLGGGSSNFPLTELQTSIVVVIIYFVVRQIQDYFIIPHVMGRITKLHPLVILIAVLAGGHTAGILGLLLAVPIAAALNILLQFSVDTVNEKELAANKKPGR